MTCEQCGRPGVQGTACLSCGHLIGTPTTVLVAPTANKSSNKTLIIVLALLGAAVLGLMSLAAVILGARTILDRPDPTALPAPSASAPSIATPPTPGQTLLGGEASGENIRRDDQATEAAWVSPTGNLFCAIDGDQVWCWAEQHTWRIPRFGCETDWGHSVFLTGDEVGYGCAGDPICLSATPGITDPCDMGVDRWPLWWFNPGDPTAYSYGEESAALPYGSSIRVRDLQCTSKKTGMDCANLATGRGFLISRDRLVLR